MPTSPKTFGSIPDKERWKQQNRWRGSASENGYDWTWTKLARIYRTQNPWCEHCWKENQFTPAELVDHIEPFHGKSDPLRLDRNNLQSLCRPCHKRKTDRDKNRSATEGA